MNYRPPGTLRVLRVLAWTSLLRLLRSAVIRRAQSARNQGERGASPRKRGDGLMILMVAMLPVFAFNALRFSSDMVQRLGMVARAATATTETLLLHQWTLGELSAIDPLVTDIELREKLADLGIGEKDQPPASRIIEHYRRHGMAGFAARPGRVLLVDPIAWPDAETERVFTAFGALLLLTLLPLLLAMDLARADVTLAGGDWTLGWLMTFPVGTRSLILARALDYALVQLLPWLVYCPVLLQLLRAQGRSGALGLAVGGTLLTTLVTGSLRLWLETWLRIRCSLRALRSVQAACSLFSFVLMLGWLTVTVRETLPLSLVEVARNFPAWLTALPASWPLRLLHGGWRATLPGVLASLGVFAVACNRTVRLLAHGVMRGGGVDPGVRGKRGEWTRSIGRLGVVGKDLAMLARDRNFLVQTLVAPIFMIAIYLVVFPDLGRLQGTSAAMLAYGIGAYSLLGGCFQVLSAEGRALWMLYTLPTPIADVLRRKVRIWAGTAVGFAFAALAAFALRSGGVALPQLLSDLLFVGGGVFCAAHVAGGISILGTDPAADYVPRQLKARHVYLYLFFVGTYFLGPQSSELAVRTAALVVFGTLAYAIWQRACDRVPWLLDPVDEHRPTIGVYDGGAAVMVFFALQLVLIIRMGWSGGAPSIQQLFVAFAIAGALTVALFLGIVGRRGVPMADVFGLPIASASRAAGSLLLGGSAGLLAGGLGLAYRQAVLRAGLIEMPELPAVDRGSLLLLAVLAAPLVEETLFRGLLFQGLSRSVELPLAVVWSAGVFAVVHPPASWLPVFVMGAVAALVFHRTRFLPAAMAVHAVYNLVVIGLPSVRF